MQPNRDHLRRLSQVWTPQPLYFLTACTYRRQSLLLRPPNASLLIEAWRDSPRINGWAIGRYVVMPDHVHFFARPVTHQKSLGAFMRDWKRWTARGIARTAGTGSPIWQAEFFDHLLRSPAAYEEKWSYVRENPVRAGLVATAESWPYAGECAPLPFTEL